MEYAVEVESTYEDFDSLKNAVKKDIELFNDFRTEYNGEDYSPGGQALLNSSEGDINFEIVEKVLDYMHENVGTSGEIARKLSSHEECVNEEHVAGFVRDLKNKGFAQRYRVSPRMKGQNRIRQLTMLKDQDSVQNYTEDKRFKEAPQTNANVPFTAQKSTEAPWEKMLEEN